MLNSIFAGTSNKPTVHVTSPISLNVSNFTLSMKCNPDERNFKYSWEKKSSLLSIRTQGVSTSCLTIFNLRPEDAGEYRCIMSNSTGRIASDYTTLHIYGVFCVTYTLLHS